MVVAEAAVAAAVAAVAVAVAVPRLAEGVAGFERAYLWEWPERVCTEHLILETRRSWHSPTVHLKLWRYKKHWHGNTNLAASRNGYIG